MDWIISANGKLYDHAKAFQKWGFIDWKQGKYKYRVGDIVYIYCTRPMMKVMYKTIVEKLDMPFDTIVDDEEFWFDKNKFQDSKNGKFARLKLIEQADRKELGYDLLLQNGLNGPPQGAFKLVPKLKEYIDQYLYDSYSTNVFPDSDLTETCIEGAKTVVYVNKYERSSIARKRCIEHYGCFCSVCGINFEDVYGSIGKDFIHVHHLIPLSEVAESYTVDYTEHLRPVCPNCHAMLHAKVDGKYLSINELKKCLKSSR